MRQVYKCPNLQIRLPPRPPHPPTAERPRSVERPVERSSFCAILAATATCRSQLKKPTANPEYLDKLKRAILQQHGCEATYLESVNTLETSKGQTVWRGIVAVFQITGHPKATRCYAWGRWLPNRKMCYVAVLGIPPINSPRKAIEVAIVPDTNQTS